jgi:hypothetical protein
MDRRHLTTRPRNDQRGAVVSTAAVGVTARKAGRSYVVPFPMASLVWSKHPQVPAHDSWTKLKGRIRRSQRSFAAFKND